MSNSNIEISFLEEQDLNECYDLCQLCFNENGAIEDVRKIYNNLKNNNSYKFIVAKKDNKIVGYTTMIIMHNLFDGEPLATLWYVCTHPDYRRMGIACKIFEKVENIAKEENCSLIYFPADNDNTNAHNFYNSIGYDGNSKKLFYKYFDKSNK